MKYEANVGMQARIMFDDFPLRARDFQTKLNVSDPNILKFKKYDGRMVELVDAYANPSNGGGLDWYCKVVGGADMGTFEIAGVLLVYDMQLRNNDSKKQNSGVRLQRLYTTMVFMMMKMLIMTIDFETDDIKAAVNDVNLNVFNENVAHSGDVAHNENEENVGNVANVANVGNVENVRNVGNVASDKSDECNDDSDMYYNEYGLNSNI